MDPHPAVSDGQRGCLELSEVSEWGLIFQVASFLEAKTSPKLWLLYKVEPSFLCLPLTLHKLHRNGDFLILL